MDLAKMLTNVHNELANCLCMNRAVNSINTGTITSAKSPMFG